MTRRAACSDRAVVECAHSASTSAIFDFACSVLFGMLHFFGFFAFTGKEMPLEVCH